MNVISIEKLRAVVEPFTELMSSINDKYAAETIFAILNGIAMAALNRSNEIVRQEIEKERIEYEANLKALNLIQWRVEMKSNGCIQGGGKNRKSRKKPKLILIDRCLAHV